MKASFPDGSCTLELEVLPALSQATSSSGLRPIESLTRVGQCPARGLLELRIAEIGYHARIDLGTTHGRRGRLSLPPIGGEGEARLASMTHRVTTNLEVVLDGRTLGFLPMSLLPPWDWPHDAAARISVASLVLPGDDSILQAVSEASARSSRVLPDLAALGSPDAILSVAEVLYRQLAEHCLIDYEATRSQNDPWCGTSYQPVRPPWNVFEDDRRGRGNCIDLSLFLAACWESLSLRPLLFFTGERSRAPTHAFVGCWLDREDRFRPVLTDADMLRSLARGNEFFALEATGVCMGSHRLDFPHALRRGREILDSESVHALDVAGLRPPIGTVRSLVLANDPIVQRAIWLGERFADRRSAQRRETVHILAGLCEAHGDVTTRLLAGSGTTPKDVQRVLERSVASETHAGPRKSTKNYQLCLSAARATARSRGRSRVEEGDLLWAVLESPSGNVRKALEAAGCDFPTLLHALRRQGEGVAEITLSRVFHQDSEGR